PREVGTKAAQLARLLQAGFPVPPGFCLTRTAYTDFLETNGLIPVLAALGYELIRWAARHYRNPLVRAIMAPGLSLQLLTTREPHAAQVEVAITALQRVLVADGALPAAASQASGSALLQQPAGTGA
ncbi:MAG: hypothetical protein C4289_03395, partial [Chloroflexota bacterium]